MKTYIAEIGGVPIRNAQKLGPIKLVELTTVAGGLKKPEQALDFLRSIDMMPTHLIHEVDDVRVYIKTVCRRCAGSGKYSYNPQDGTVCFGCRGTQPSVISSASLVKEAEAFRRRLRTNAQRALRKDAEAQTYANEREANRMAWLNSSPYTLPLNAWRGGQLTSTDIARLGRFWDLLGDHPKVTEGGGVDFSIAMLARKAEALKETIITPVAGRYVIEGEVVSIRSVASHFGLRERCTIKAPVQGGVSVYHLTFPSGSRWEIGDRVGVTVTIEPSDDGQVGWAKRPTNPYKK